MAENQQARPSTSNQVADQTQAPVPPHSSVVNPFAAGPKCQPEASTEASKSKEKPLFWMIRPEWVIVWVTIAYVILTALTLRAIKRQADAMDAAQLTADKSANAALLSAQTAQRSADAFRNRERARVRIAFDNNLQTDDPFFTDIAYTLTCFGPTPALVEEAKGVCTLEDGDEPRMPGIGFSLNLPPIFRESEIAGRIHVLQGGPLSPEQLVDIDEKRVSLLLHGFIRYKDVFGDSQETAFLYRFVTSPYTFSDGTRFRRWERVGPPEANKET